MVAGPFVHRRPDLPVREETTTSARPPVSWWSRIDDRVSALMVLLSLGDLLAAAAVVVAAPIPRVPAVLLVAAVLLCRAAARLYRPRLRLAYLDDVPRVLVSAGVGLLAASVASVLLGLPDVPARALVATLCLLVVAGEVLRAVGLAVVRYARRHLGRGDRTLVVAGDDVGRELVDTMVAHREFGLRPVGMLWTSPDAPAGRPAPSVPFLDEGLATAVRARAVDTVVLAFPSHDTDVAEKIVTSAALGCRVLVLPPQYELYDDNPCVERLRGFPLIRMSGDPTRRVSWQLKRLVDVVVSVVALVVLLPLMAAITVAIRFEGRGPVFFSQVRVGRGGRPFRLHKFRTLTPVDDAESATRWSVDGDARIARLGRFLRTTSLDELPQLWDVLRGAMSLVGPRPERPAFVEEFSARHTRYGYRHRVPAGITGLAQINGLRGDTSIADRARHDNYYIASWSLWLDLRIMLLTAGELLRHVR